MPRVSNEKASGKPSIEHIFISSARLLLVLVASASIFSILSARLSHSSEDEGLIIASRRSTAEDTLYQAIARSKDNVTYVREGDPFFDSVRNFVLSQRKDASSASLYIVRAVKKDGRFVARELVATNVEDSTSAVSGFAGSEEAPMEALLIPSAIVVGLIFGGVALLAKVPVFLYLSAATVLSGYQYYAHCPTCPDTTVAGIPASHIGVAVFGLLSLLSTVQPVGGTMRSSLIGGIVFGVLGWQAFQNQASLAACMPCVAIAFLGALALGGLPQTDAKFGLKAAAIPIFGLVASLCLVMARDPSPVESGAIAGFEGQIADRGFALKGVVGRPASEIGLSLPPKRTVVVVVATGCDPCHDAMDFLSRRPDIPVMVAETNSAATTEQVMRIPSGILRQTPTFLLVEADGTIAGERIGWSDDSDWQKAFVRDTTQFLSGSLKAPRQKEREVSK